MPVGTIKWIPRHPGRVKLALLTSKWIRIFSFASALLICGLIALSFWLGKKAGEGSTTKEEDIKTNIISGEMYQLRSRIDEIENILMEIAEREEAILVAAAGLNLDFSELLPPAWQNNAALYDNESSLFEYIDDLDLRLLLARRLAEAEYLAYDSLASRLVELSDELKRIPSIWPTNGIFVSDFGPRIDPFTGAVRFHKGIDISSNTGTPIYAPADGVVIFCGWSSGWGLTVVIRHTNRISTRFAHSSSILVVVGQSVSRGDLIARIGSTGRSVGPHLHYEVLIDGVQVDPEDYIIRAGPHEAAF